MNIDKAKPDELKQAHSAGVFEGAVSFNDDEGRFREVAFIYREPNAAADAYYNIASGIGRAEARMDARRAAAALAESGQADLGAATSGLISVVNACNTPAETMSDLSDVFPQTVRKGVGSLDGFAGAMSSISGIAASVGGGFDELGSSMAQTQSYEARVAKLQAASDSLAIQMGDDTNKIKGFFVDIGTGFLTNVVPPILSSPVGGVFQGIAAGVGLAAQSVMGIGSGVLQTASQLVVMTATVQNAGGFTHLFGNALGGLLSPLKKGVSGRRAACRTAPNRKRNSLRHSRAGAGVVGAPFKDTGCRQSRGGIPRCWDGGGGYWRARIPERTAAPPPGSPATLCVPHNLLCVLWIHLCVLWIHLCVFRSRLYGSWSHLYALAV